MATFIIIPTESTEKFDAELPSRFGNKSFRLPRGEWMVNYDGTSQQLSDELGISEGEIGPAVVLNFAAYWGRAPSNLWEWMAENPN